MKESLKSLKEISRDIADDFGIPTEIVEAIIVRWIKILYLGVTGKEIDDLLSKL